MSETARPYRVYWVTWIVLLVITVGMLGAEALNLPNWFLLGFLLIFMMVKATMIAGTFMHLRYEKRNLAIMVGTGILVTSVILYAFISQETGRLLELTTR